MKAVQRYRGLDQNGKSLVQAGLILAPIVGYVVYEVLAKLVG